jgi:hypothetical protein
MRQYIVFPILGLLALTLPSVMPSMDSPQDDLKVILVDLNVKTPADAGKCYSNTFDSKRVELSLDIDDPLNTLEDYAMSEDPLQGPDCFMPELKVIFREYTYVFSMYCTAVKKYGNSAPFIPSAKALKPDIEMTESVVEYLDATRKKYFGTTVDPKVAAVFNKAKSLDPIPADKVDDSDLYKDDDDNDKDIEKDAIDKEGWFDKVKDPGLEDETPNDSLDVGGN